MYENVLKQYNFIYKHYVQSIYKHEFSSQSFQTIPPQYISLLCLPLVYVEKILQATINSHNMAPITHSTKQTSLGINIFFI